MELVTEIGEVVLADFDDLPEEALFRYSDIKELRSRGLRIADDMDTS